MTAPLLRWLRPSYDGPVSWLWFVGFARILVLLVVAAGTLFIERGTLYTYVLAIIYGGALLSSVWYLITLRRERSVSAVLTWTQMFVDFSVVTATIGFTGGQTSFFTFLLVIVILEAGVLLGLMQGFVFATLAGAVMLFETVRTGALLGDPLMQWYNLLIQCIAFYFTAFISGYWNQRVSRMKQFQREILDNMNSGFLITDEKGIVQAVNRSACRILSLVADNVVGRHVDGILVPEAGVECPITTALRSGRDFTSYEFLALIGNDETKLLGLTTSRMQDPTSGLLTGIIASFSDLTEMARMREEVKRQDRLAVVGELAAGLAHEIRNPVAAIRGAVDELASNLDQHALAERLARIAMRESDHLNEIVSSFLDFARKPEPKREVFDLCSIVEETQQRLARTFGDRAGLDIRLSLPPSPVYVEGDSSQLEQVFINIGQNAVEANLHRGRVLITLLPASGHAEVRFEDEGPGISPDKVARIFEPFYTEKERGVGMGLAVCHRIVTAHDGSIQVAARPGGGTTMSVRLPART